MRTGVEPTPSEAGAAESGAQDGVAVPVARPAWKRWMPALVLAAGLIGFFALGLDRYASFAALAEHRAAIEGWVAANPVLSRVGYAAVYALSIAFSLPVGLVLTVSGGMLFGLVEGTLLTVAAATLGAFAVFLAARSALGDVLRRRAGPFVARLEAGFRANALSYLLVLRLVPLFPFWLVNIVPALLGVPARIYLLATFFGIMPGTFVFVSVGNGLDALLAQGRVPGVEVFLEPPVLIPLAGLTVLALVPVAYRRLRRRDETR